MLDLTLTKLGLKIKNMVVLDLSFPHLMCPEFRKNYETRFIAMPNRQEMVLEFAGGLASFGKIVLVLGYEGNGLTRLDPTVNVKVLKNCPEGTWERLEERILEFGPAEILIPV